MAWELKIVVDGIRLVVQTMTGFFGLMSDNPGEMLGFYTRDPQVIDLIRTRDPRLFDVLNEALDDLDELRLIGWSSDSAWWDEPILSQKDSDELERELRTISQSRYALPQQRQHALDILANLHRKQVREDLIRQRRNQFHQVHQDRLLALIDRDGLVCVECGAYENLTIDHIVPISKGGTDDLENLQLLCRSCNSSKGDRVDE